MQAHQGNREKRLVKLGVPIVRAKIGKSAKPENIHETLLNSSSESLKKFVSNINGTADKIQNIYQKVTIKELAELGIWVALQHPDLKEPVIEIISRITGIPATDIRMDSKLSRLDLFFIDKGLKYISGKLTEKVPASHYKYLHDDVESCTNDACQYIWLVTKQVMGKYEDNSTRDALMVLIEVGIWAAVHDTAFRDAFFYFINKVGNKKIRDLIKLHPTRLVKPPSEWYPNLWKRGHDKTVEGKKSGELLPGEFSYLEQFCVPQIQRKMIKESRKRK